MPSRETLERFIARVEANAHVEAVEEFYTENSTMRENHAPPRVGRAAHAANERLVMARASRMMFLCDSLNVCPPARCALWPPHQSIPHTTPSGVPRALPG